MIYFQETREGSQVGKLKLKPHADPYVYKEYDVEKWKRIKKIIDSKYFFGDKWKNMLKEEVQNYFFSIFKSF